MGRIGETLAVVATLLAGGAVPAGAQTSPAGTLRITAAGVPGPAPATPEAAPALTGLRLRPARAPGAEYGPFTIESRGSEDVDLPAGSYVAFGARLRRAACPDTPFEIKAGRRVALVFETAAPGAAVPVCAVRVTAGS